MATESYHLTDTQRVLLSAAGDLIAEANAICDDEGVEVRWAILVTSGADKLAAATAREVLAETQEETGSVPSAPEAEKPTSGWKNLHA